MDTIKGLSLSHGGRWDMMQKHSGNNARNCWCQFEQDTNLTWSLFSVTFYTYYMTVNSNISLQIVPLWSMDGERIQWKAAQEQNTTLGLLNIILKVSFSPLKLYKDQTPNLKTSEFWRGCVSINYFLNTQLILKTNNFNSFCNPRGREIIINLFQWFPCSFQKQCVSLLHLLGQRLAKTVGTLLSSKFNLEI